MKLLMLGSGSPKSTLSIRLVALARHLARDWDVTVLLPSADKYNDFRPDPTVSIEGVKLVQPWQFTTRNPLLNLIPYLLTAAIATLRAGADVVYVYKPTPITIVGLLPRLLGRTPVVLDLDDQGSEVMKLEGRPWLEHGLVAWCERLTLRYASAVVVASTLLESQVKATYPDKPVLLLPNGVEPGDYHPKIAGELRPAIYYFGALNRLSLVEGLIRAVPAIVRDVPDAQITIIGGGAALEEAKRLAAKLAVAGRITFTGWTDMLAAQSYTCAGDVAVCYQPDMPTVRAASNMKVFQYMAMRTVPVVSDVGDLARYVEDGAAGVVVSPGDTRALARAVVALLKDPARRQRLADRAFSLAQADYSWQQRSRQVAKFIGGLRRSGKDG